MTGSIPLSTKLMTQIINAMPSLPENNAAIQLVVYTEEGIEVFIPPVPRNIPSNLSIGQSNNSGNMTASYVRANDSSVVITVDSGHPNPFQLESDTNYIISVCGGGGGGGNASTIFTSSRKEAMLSGGGGGSGSLASTQYKTLSRPFVTRLEYVIGAGGGPGEAGGITKAIIKNMHGDIVGSAIAAGGNKGQIGERGACGRGGNGGAGGGGGGTYPRRISPTIGVGGAGLGGRPSENGQMGTHEYRGGNGGIAPHDPANSEPGLGGYYKVGDLGGGGGGGGGDGGGNGGDNDNTNGRDAVITSGSGGGGAAAQVQKGINGNPDIPSVGGKGGNGYIRLIKQ